MIALLQRVSEASVCVDGDVVAQIKQGLLVLIGVERGDSKAIVERMVERLLGYRVFADTEGKMNLNVRDIQGSMLIVPQFTLAADTSRGMRPSFSSAATPQESKSLFDYLLSHMRVDYPQVEAGRFGADMQVALVNDGPVTFNLRVGGEK